MIESSCKDDLGTPENQHNTNWFAVKKPLNHIQNHLIIFF